MAMVIFNSLRPAKWNTFSNTRRAPTFESNLNVMVGFMLYNCISRSVTFPDWPLRPCRFFCFGTRRYSDICTISTMEKLHLLKNNWATSITLSQVYLTGPSPSPSLSLSLYISLYLYFLTCSLSTPSPSPFIPIYIYIYISAYISLSLSVYFLTLSLPLPPASFYSGSISLSLFFCHAPNIITANHLLGLKNHCFHG